jgi:Tfp pilus assembly protein PilZ
VARSEQEHRLHRRFEVHDIAGVFLFDVDATVLNLSLGGMALESTHALQVGRRYSFRIRDGAELVAVSGVVAWCNLRRTRREEGDQIVPCYQAGVRFEGIITSTAEELGRLIEGNAVVEVGQRVFGRFRVEADSPLSVATQVDFEVCKISLSGMLVEAEVEVDLETRVQLEVRLVNGLYACRGRVAYIRPPQRSWEKRTQIGVEFLDPSPERRLLLEDFIAFLVHADPD